MGNDSSAQLETDSSVDSKPSPSTPSPHISPSLNDMPEEIMHEIVAFLLKGQCVDGYYIRHRALEKYEDPERRARQLKDVLGLSSCCKWMRPVVFGRWILERLLVHNKRKELDALVALSDELRGYVRWLYIIPGHPDANDFGSPFNFTDFIRPCTNLEKLSIQWQFFTKDDPRLLGLRAAAAHDTLDEECQTVEKQSSDLRLSSNHVRAVTVHTYADPAADGDDLEHIEQLRCLLHQLRFPHLKLLRLTFGSFIGLHTCNSQALWAALMRAFRSSSFPCLETLSLECKMVMNGRAVCIDLCDIWAQVFQTCWQSSNMESITLRLILVGEPGDSFRLWTTDNSNPDSPTLNPAVLPPSSRLLKLLDTCKGSSRHRFEYFIFDLECQIPWAPKDKDYIVVSWSFSYPDWAQIKLSEHVNDDEDTNPAELTALPVGDEFAILSVKDSHVHSACKFILGELEAMRELRAVFGGGRAGPDPLIRAFAQRLGIFEGHVDYEG